MNRARHIKLACRVKQILKVSAIVDSVARRKVRISLGAFALRVDEPMKRTLLWLLLLFPGAVSAQNYRYCVGSV
jgi:hypothetical protein